MKKLMIIGLLAVPSLAVAETPLPFTGVEVNVDIATTKHKYSIPNQELYNGLPGDYQTSGKNKTSLGIGAGYGFNFGESNFVGIGQVRFYFGNGKSYDEDGDVITKQRTLTSLTYLQGYRINAFLPYVMASIDVGSFDFYEENLPKAYYVSIENNMAYGVGYGAGVKYQLTDQLGMGIEYRKIHLQANNSMKFDVNQFNLNMTYRF